MGAGRSRSVGQGLPSESQVAEALAPLRGRLVLCSGERGEVVVYKLDEAGAPVLRPVEKAEKVEGSTAVEWLVVHPVLPRLYALSSFWKPMSKVRAAQTRHGELNVFGIDAATGSLSRLASLDSGGHQPCAGTCSPDGSLLAVAHYLDGRVSVFPLDGSGNPVAEGARVLRLPWKQGKEVSDAERLMDGVTGPLCHGLAFSPSGRWIATCDAGQGRIVVFPASASDGAEATVADVLSAPPAGRIQLRIARRFGQRPRHAAFHPSGRYIYVLHECANRVTAHTFDEQTGTVGQAFQDLASGAIQDACCLCMAGASAAAEIAASADGSCLLVSNRGIRSGSSLASFAITEAGRLEPRSQTSALGKSPRHFLLHGSLLLAGLECSGALGAFACGGDGRLAPLASLELGKELSEKGPMCVQLFPAS